MSSECFSKSSEVKLFVILVTYFPDHERLIACLKAIEDQAYACILVNNTPTDSTHKIPYAPKMIFEEMPLGKNMGIAYAQNRGIQRAITSGASHIFFLDQDSIIQKNGIKQLIDLLQKLTSKGEKIAACCATPTDDNNPEGYPVIKENNGWPKRTKISPNDRIIEVMHTISSGSLMPASIFKSVGLMNESLFIDYVDTEWFLRARKMGFLTYLDKNVVLSHKLGEKQIKLSIGKQNRCIPIYPSIRYYYQTRNFLILCKMKHVHWKWILWHMPVALAIKPFLILLNSENKLSIASAMVRGFIHGIIQSK